MKAELAVLVDIRDSLKKINKNLILSTQITLMIDSGKMPKEQAEHSISLLAKMEN